MTWQHIQPNDWIIIAGVARQGPQRSAADKVTWIITASQMSTAFAR